ncbi:MAG: DNA-directed RNA polymerase subunit alpha C-terminal domain-containing protein [Planctomycetia bacterium]|nr:DNA-directed RNA polymerase subunit alpha C-terminal domain-containing protein [Planctomycetia bacterium]
MSQMSDFDLKQAVLFGGAFGPREISRIQESIAVDVSAWRTLRDAVAELDTGSGDADDFTDTAETSPVEASGDGTESDDGAIPGDGAEADRGEHSPAGYVRLGICLYILGRYRRALKMLRRGDGGPMDRFYIAKVYSAMDDHASAAAAFLEARTAGYDADACLLGRAESQRRMGQPEQALETLEQISATGRRSAEYSCQRAVTLAKLCGDPAEIVSLYERAVEADPQHEGALFGLAMENDRHGNDATALEYYQRAAAHSPSHVGVLMNLGILYEDLGHHERAVECYRRILASHPENQRARLFLRDALASGEMCYDETEQKHRDRINQTMSVSVGDFELSQRARNCLQKMGIRTLGDLCRCTEADLLASRNFGETSLTEIRDMLASKGLRLGQQAVERRLTDASGEDVLTPDEQAKLERPISDLALSVRARKCMARLGINTIGDLTRLTGDQLLECKNFGVTSLNEVREKLKAANLRLRGE